MVKPPAAPITILFKNGNTRSGDYEKQRAVPRPGHADFVAHQKFKGFEDYPRWRPFQRKAYGGFGCCRSGSKKSN